MEEGKLIEEGARELVKGGPLAVILGYVLWRLERTVRELRDDVRDWIRHKKETDILKR